MLGWSVTRYDVFVKCKRMYFYQYYDKYDPDFSRQEIQKLKQLTSIPLEIGNIVHDILKTFLERLQKSSEPIDQERFFNFSKKLTLDYTGAKTFFEAFYNGVTEIDPLEMVYPKVEQCLQNFMNSERFEWLMQEPMETKAKWVIEPPGYGRTTINGFKAYCKVDFLFPTNNRLRIIDWKTGQKDDEKHKKQLTAYAHWASDKFAQDPANIQCHSVYLFPTYEEVEIQNSPEDIAAFAGQVQEETHEMWAYCVDVEQNLPSQKSNFQPTINTGLCKYCNFQKLCYPEMGTST